MTSSLIRGRPRRAKAHIRVRVTHAVLGALVGAGWLVLPVMTAGEHDPVPVSPAGQVASAATTQQEGTSVTDLLMPLVAVGAAGVLAGYGYLRRTRRARTRTTPGVVSAAPPVPTTVESERQARAALVLADDCVRASSEELPFVEELFGSEAVEPYVHALRAAQTELSAAFAIWRRYEEGVPGDASARRQALVGVVGRCAEAGRRLDAEAEGLDLLRGLEQGVGAALEVAEGRFRELTARTAAAQATAAELHLRYAPSAGAPVTGYVEQAKDRLVFATSQLNESRQAADSGDGQRAARRLRAAEGGVAQAGVLVGGVERLAAQLREAAALVPAALTGGEAEIAEARRNGGRLAPGELHARIAHADGVLAAVRTELTTGPYDPLDALRRIARAVERLEVGRSGAVKAAARLVSHSALGEAEDFIAVHRGAVGAAARARLAEAERALGGAEGFIAVQRKAVGAEARARLAEGERALGEAEDYIAVHQGAVGAAARPRPAEAERALGSGADADVLAREARDLAERDVRAHGNPYADGHATGLTGAVLGGILLAEEPDGGPPASFGGPETRGRRHAR